MREGPIHYNYVSGAYMDFYVITHLGIKFFFMQHNMYVGLVR